MDWFCKECEYFRADKFRNTGGGFKQYGCDYKGYIPQHVKDISQIACGCGAFKKGNEQLSLFGGNP